MMTTSEEIKILAVNFTKEIENHKEPVILLKQILNILHLSFEDKTLKQHISQYLLPDICLIISKQQTFINPDVFFPLAFFLVYCQFTRIHSSYDSPFYPRFTNQLYKSQIYSESKVFI